MRAVLALVCLLIAVPALAFDPFQATGIDRRPDAVVPLDLSFVDQAGAITTLRALGAGKPILLAPVVHRCPNICGLTLAGLAAAVQAQKFRPGRDFVLVAFGIDPREGAADARASLAELQRYFPLFKVDGVSGLTGREADVAQVTDALGYRYAWDDRLAQYAHISAVAVLTPDGRLSRWLYGIAPDPLDVRLGLTEAGEGRTGSWSDQLLLLCYHYDPVTGQYGSLIWLLLRIAGAATALAGSALIALAILRERRKARSTAP